VTIFRILLGIVMLVSGRNLFWLFLGIVGFIFGFEIAGHLFQGESQGVIFIIAMILGVASSLLAVLLQKFAILAGGFVAGGYLLPALVKEFGANPGHHYWLFFIAGGVLGALLMKVFFNSALIVLSAAIGSQLIIHSLHFGPYLRKVLFVFLLISGIIIQAGTTKRQSRTRPG
jgi:hypothetical protein